MKKKVSMKYLLEHADAENLERIARDYPAPESRKKELFPEYAYTEESDSTPVTRSFRWNAALPVATAFVLIAGNVLLFTNLPKPRQTASQLQNEETVPTSDNRPGNSVTEEETEPQEETDTRFRRTTVVYEVSGKQTVSAVTVPESGTTAVKASAGKATTVSPAESGTASAQTSGKKTLTTKTTVTAPVQMMPQPLAEPGSQTEETVPPVLPEIPGYTIIRDKSLNSDAYVYHLDSQAHVSKGVDEMRERYQPINLPDGYALNRVYGWDTTTNRTLLFDQNNEKGILFQQTFWTGKRLEIPEQYISDVKPVMINGTYGYTVTYPVQGIGFVSDLAKTGNYTPQTLTVLVYDTNLCQFMFKGEDISAEELLAMADSMPNEHFPRYSSGIASGEFDNWEYEWERETETEPPTERETEPIPTAPVLPVDPEIPEFPGYRIEHFIDPIGKEKYLLYPAEGFEIDYNNFESSMTDFEEVHTIRKYYQPTSYPEGFSDAVCGEDLIGKQRFLLYPNGIRNSISFVQEGFLSNHFEIPADEIMQCRPVMINSMYGYIRTVPAKGDSLLGQHMRAFMDLDDYLPTTLTILVWNDGVNWFQMTGEDVSEDDIIRMAESCVYETIPRYAGGINSKLYEGYPFPYQE